MKTCESFPERKSRCRMGLVCAAYAAFLFLSFPTHAGSQDGPAVVPSQTPMELKPYLIAPGQRLHKPGRERIEAAGNITYLEGDRPRVEPVRITWQIPLKVRLSRNGTWVGFDAGNPAQIVPRSPKVAETIQTLLEDSVEGLFALQKKRVSMRYLGSDFKLEGAKESDPGMDVVLISYPDRFREKQTTLKSYWFDSSTKLLGVVAYTSASGAATHTVIKDWREVSGEKIPFCIERWEDNRLAIRLVLDSVSVSAGANDGAFGGN